MGCHRHALATLGEIRHLAIDSGKASGRSLFGCKATAVVRVPYGTKIALLATRPLVLRVLQRALPLLLPLLRLSLTVFPTILKDCARKPAGVTAAGAPLHGSKFAAHDDGFAHTSTVASAG